MEDFKKPEFNKKKNINESLPEKDIPQCPFKVPPWSAPPPSEHQYKFEVLKSGLIIDEIKDLESKATWTFGRLPQNDVELAHPTISRFHCVLQYRPSQADAQDKPPEGWYIYDLDSTHGTFLNKQRLPAHVFMRIRVGHMLRLGTSTRHFILQGPVDDEEPETELGVTELREKKKMLEEEAQKRAEEALQKQSSEGINWGMSEDADEETDLKHNPYAMTTNEDLFLDDPKKTLRGYFEREGHILEYKCDEMSMGTFVCRVELPIDDENGRSLMAEVIHKGKKKECVAQCALEACRILDRYGVLRPSNQEPKKRTIKKPDSDSDDDFLDRTGDVARKKQRKSNANANITFTYDDLLKKADELKIQIAEVDEQILNYQNRQEEQKKAAEAQKQSEDIDSYMENLCESSTKLDKTEIRKLRMQQQNLKAEFEKTKRLIQLTKPADLPFLLDTNVNTTTNKTNTEPKKQLPMIGKRNQFSKFKVVKEVPKSLVKVGNLGSDEEEVEEESENESDTKEKKEISNDDKKTEKLYGPAVIPKEIIEQKTNLETTETIEIEVKKEDEKKNITQELSETEVMQPTNEEEQKVVENTKKRHRQRHRKRQDQLEGESQLEEHESLEKYAKWVPPQNQSGDGFTELNAKYGY